jgi:hypothetical protein
MTIETLIKVVPPPAAPFEAFGGPWEPIEAELGTALPQDYKDFVRLYGNGYFMEFLGVNVPSSGNPNTRLESQVPVICATFFDFDDEELPYPLWAHPGGLVPFGGTDNGDFLFWLPRGAPADWGVVVWDRGLYGFEAFDCDLTDFLAGLATGEILPKEFPDDLLPCDCLFRPDSSEPARQRLRLAAADPADASFSFSWRIGGYGTGLSGISTCRLCDDE